MTSYTAGFLWVKSTIQSSTIEYNGTMFYLKKCNLTMGVQVSEAMKAQSQAFVTEDGTAVKKDEKVTNPLKLL